MDVTPKINRQKYPPTLLPSQCCRLCQAPAGQSHLCKPCDSSLPKLIPPSLDTGQAGSCYRCALPLNTRDDSVCGECLQHPPAFHRTIAACRYQPPISQWLQYFKYEGDLRDGQLLSQILLSSLRQTYTQERWPDLLIPVPLHWRRLFKRGFNQTAWACRQLSHPLKIPVHDALQRRRGGHNQQQLSRQQRLRNLRQVFHLRHGAAKRLAGRHVALVDDVVTTTATTRTLSQLLIDAGCARVDVWCLARTNKPGE